MRIGMAAPEPFAQDVAEVVRTFGELGEGEPRLTATLNREGELWIARAQIGDARYECQRIGGGSSVADKRQAKRAIKVAAFRALRAYTGQVQPWGSLTGIRPSKLAYEMLGQGMAPEAVREAFQETYDVLPEKAELLMRIVEQQRPILCRDWRHVADVYVGIPFCRGRCLYCSFPSVDIERRGGLTDAYVAALCREIAWAGRVLAERRYRIRGLYFGGGTPTAIPTQQFATVLDACRVAFGSGFEWTVEAGRPDTIDRERLELMRAAGVTRVSVNPQTMNAATLERVGRKHTPEDILASYALVREYPFLVNMDLIAGLPGEGPEEMAYTLERIAALRPDNLTVHTLAIKRASQLKGRPEMALPGPEAVCRMVEMGAQTAADLGLEPYYLYRQKYMTGNLENVGYARPGTACLYNVDIMEETLPVMALGAGAITKWMIHDTLFDRAANVKSVEQYVERLPEMLLRKEFLLNRACQSRESPIE